jgi:hypothetical protein
LHDEKEKAAVTGTCTSAVDAIAVPVSPVSSDGIAVTTNNSFNKMMLLNNNSIIDHTSGLGVNDHVPIILADHRPKMVAWNKLLNCFCNDDKEHQQESENNNINDNNYINNNNNIHNAYVVGITSTSCSGDGIINSNSPNDVMLFTSTKAVCDGENFDTKDQSQSKQSPLLGGFGLHGMFRRHDSSESLVESSEVVEKDSNRVSPSYPQRHTHCHEEQQQPYAYQYEHHQQQQHPHYYPQQEIHHHHHLYPIHAAQQQLLQEYNQYHAPPFNQNPFMYGQQHIHQHNPPDHYYHHYHEQQQQHKHNSHHDINEDGYGNGGDCGGSEVSDFTESVTSYLSLSFSDDDDDDEEKDLIVGRPDDAKNRQDNRQQQQQGSCIDDGGGGGGTTNRHSAFRIPTKKNSNKFAKATDALTTKSTQKAAVKAAQQADNNGTTTNTSPNRPPVISTRASSMGASADNDAETVALNVDKTIKKPAVMSVRSRSAVDLSSKDNNTNTNNNKPRLPPLVPSSSGYLDNCGPYNSNQTQSRRRCDTGDGSFLTRTSTTTNGSRHRRDKQFAFSDDSISEIWKLDWAATNGGAVPPPPPPAAATHPTNSVPLSYVTFREAPAKLVENGSYRRVSDISALATSLSFGTTGRSFDMDQFGDILNEEEETYVIRDEDSSSPFAELERTHVDAEQKQLSNQDMIRHSPPKPSGKEDDHSSGYLRKNSSLDETTDGNVVLSGWLAVAFHDDLTFGFDPEKEVIADEFPSSPDDIFYLRVAVTSNGRARLLLQRSSSGGGIEHSFTIHSNWICHSRDTTRSKGRSVLIHLGDSSDNNTVASDTTNESSKVLVLLPVSLGSSFYNDHRALVSKTTFCKLQNNLFPTDRAGYAPDEQVDSAMHIIFTIDSLIKRQGIL